MLKRKLQQLHRYQIITTAFARSGLGYVLDEMGLKDKLPFGSNNEKIKKGISLGARIRMLLEELGPTFIKLGQIGSTRPDLIPAPIITELSQLQDRVLAFETAVVHDIILEELGEPVETLFEYFNEIPLAAASIGQVHQARLKDGSEVVVKVQRPNIQMTLETDLDILADWARLAESKLEWARNYRLCEIVDELNKALRAEMDYMLEARNTEKFERLCAKIEHVQAPAVYWDYTTKRVLTTSYIKGIKLSDRDAIIEAGLDCKLLAERLATTIFHQILVEGTFHGDPHPGNVFALPNNELALIDFGMIGRLSPNMKKQFASFVISLRNQSAKGIIRAISNMGIMPEDVNYYTLQADVDMMQEKYYNVPLNQISIGTAVNDLFGLAQRHHIIIPSELTLLGKSLLTMEGVVTALDPQISIFDVAEPFGKKLLLDRLNPRKRMKEWVEEVPDYAEVIAETPATLKKLSALIRSGKLRMDANLPQLEQLMAKADRMSNRLSFSIILLSLSIVLAGLIIGVAFSDSQTLLWRVPIIEIGFVVVLIAFLWLIYAIYKSGKF